MNKIAKSIDKYIAICGILIGILIVMLSYSYGIHQYDVGFTVLVSSLIYIIFKSKLVSCVENTYYISDRVVSLITNIIFLLSLTGSVWLLYSELYSRSLIYFILVSIAAASIAYEIFYLERKNAWFILTKILLLGFSIRGGIFYEFPSLYGTDPYWHVRIINKWIETGFNPIGETFTGSNQYFSFPIMHISVAMMNVLSTLNIKDSYYFIVGSFNVISIMFVYLLGKRLVSHQCGLLSALIVSVSDYHIYFGTWIIPNSLGMVFVYILSFFILEKKHPVIYKTFFILFSGLLILTHTLSTFIMIVILFSVVLGDILYSKLLENKNLTSVANVSEKIHVTFSTLILFSGMVMSYWMYNSYRVSTSFLNMITRALFRALNTDVEVANAANVSVQVVESGFEYIINNTGYLILLLFGIIGTMLWMSSEKGNKQRTILTIVTITLFIFLYGFPLLGLRIIFSGRWFVFVYLFLSVLASYSILLFSRQFKEFKISSTFVSIIILVLTFFMVTNTLTNNDSPIYAREEASRIGYTDTELKAAERLANVHENITTDQYYGIVFYFQYETKSNLNYFRIAKSNTTGSELVVIRDYVKHNPVQMKNEKGLNIPHKVDESYLKQFKSFNLVYNNGMTSAYIIIK